MVKRRLSRAAVATEEDDEETEDLPADSLSRRKRKKRVQSYLDTEAQEDDDGEEDEYEGDEGDDVDGFLDEAEEARELELANRRQADAKMAAHQMAGRLATTIGQLEQRYQNQDYATGGSGVAYGENALTGGEFVDAGDDEDEAEFDEDAVTEDLGRILPTASTWRLWKVPTVKPGVEKETCIQILMRYADSTEQQRDAFLIGSAYASDTVKGCVYVESPSPLYVIDALRDVRNLLLTKSRIRMVPIKEMADVFRTGLDSMADFPKVGQWVRITRGLYAGDLALVSETSDVTQSVTIRVVPRIDLNWEVKALSRMADGLAGGSESRADNTLKPPVCRPAPALVCLADLESRGVEPERVNHITEAFKFKSFVIEERTGYLLKTVKVSTLITGQKVQPTAMEIEAFGDRKLLGELMGENTVAAMEALVGVGESLYDIGQRVWVCKGDLAGISGVVLSQEKNKQLKLKPDAEDVTTVTVPASYCMKRFSHGESVKVIAGRHEGDTGLLLKLDRNTGTALVHSTETQQQFSCELAHLATTPHDALMPAGLVKIDGYAVGDLVQLSTTLEVGVIVKALRTRRVDVLTKDGIVSCNVAQLAGKKLLRLAHSLDCEQQQFGTGASVEILEGPNAKKIGTVRYIWKDTVFVSIPSAISTGGLLAVDSSCVRVAQGAETDLSIPHSGGTASGSAGHIGPGGMRSGASSGRPKGQLGFRANFALMGAPVKLVSGAQKGMNGELRSLQGADAIVLVSALGKEMRFPRSCIQLIDTEKSREVARYFRPMRSQRAD